MTAAPTYKVTRVARIALPLVCLIGAGFAGTSLYNHAAILYGLNTGPSFCTISEHINCDAVSASKFSTFLGFPLDGYGLVFYLSIFILSLVAFKGRLIPQRLFGNALLLTSLLASLLSIALFFISEFVVGALCILCLGMHFSNFALLILAAALGPDEAFLRRLQNGAATLISLPRSILRAPAAQRVSVWLITLGLCALTSIVLRSPPFIASFIAARSPERAQFEEVIKIAINDWGNQIPVNIQIDESEGLGRDYSRGPIFAPLQLVEFSDYECPACRNFYFPLDDLLKQYADKVHFVFKNYPLDRECNDELDRDMHRSACYAAHFARCAGEQGKFWEVTDYIFRLEELDDPKSKPEVDAAIARASEALNLDGQAIQQCLQSGRQIKKIKQDLSEGSRMGVAGTPSLWLNGRKVKVPNPVILKRLFEKVLSGSAPQQK